MRRIAPMPWPRALRRLSFRSLAPDTWQPFAGSPVLQYPGGVACGAPRARTSGTLAY